MFAILATLALATGVLQLREVRVMPPAYAAIAGFTVAIVAAFGYSNTFGGFGGTLVNVACWFLPLLSKQGRLIDAAIQGSVLDSGPILEVIAYRACWTLLLLALGVYGFSRRDLAPHV